MALPTTNVVCIDCDRCLAFPKNTKKPDFIVVEFTAPNSRLYFANCFVIEMKTTTKEVSSLLAQVQSGVNALDDERFALPTSKINVFGIVARKPAGRSHADDTAVLRNAKILFHGQKFPIILSQCGKSLTEIINPGVS